MKAYFSVDVERDLHTLDNEGLEKGLPKLLTILHKNHLKAVFFVLGDVIRTHPTLIKSLKKAGHEIAIHGYSHKRFDLMSFSEKEKELQKSIKEYVKVIGHPPKGFRAPQHSIDQETIALLSKNNFSYDSSVCSKNIMLLRHLMTAGTNKKEIVRNFLGPSKRYTLSRNLIEIPRSSPFLAIGGFELKVYPRFLIVLLIKAHKFLGIPLNFVMHSWDLIDVKGSRTTKLCSAEKFINNLEWFIPLARKHFDFVCMGDSI